MQTKSIKAQAHQLVDNLPDNANWEDVMYRIYVRQAIDAGIEDSDAGRTVDVKKCAEDVVCRRESPLDQQRG